MLAVLIIAVLAAVAAVLRGGSLESLAATKVKWLWLVWIALIVQVGFRVFEPSWLTDAWGLVVLIATNLAIVWFMVLNWKQPGMILAAVGLLMNLVVITANGAMPVSDYVFEVIDIDESTLDSAGFKHERMTGDTVLPWLGDVVPIAPLREVWSVGDFVLAAGIGWFVWKRTLASRLPDGS
ncbi:MAG TPA: DUF5317 domain-containing protein [Actinomycetota bacterium]|nr:DUF5317 domain-containing protein [Actinomycetota bacterium]